MRLALSKYINEHQQEIFIDLLGSDILISKHLPIVYLHKEGRFNFKSFIDDYVLSMHNEAEKLIIYLAPIVFNVNLNLYILEGAANLNKKFNFLKQNFSCLLGENKLNNFSSTITLFYRFSNYDVLYPTQQMMEFGNMITFSLFDNSKIVDATKQRISLFAEVPCDNCSQQSELLLFSHLPGLSLCKSCLNNLINKVILKRTKSYSNESFVNKEYYCRPILLDRENNYMLYDEDVLALTGKTISQLFLLLLDQVCLFCQSVLNENPYFTMPCECKICAKCCEMRINAATDGKVVLNNFEKTYANPKIPNCACGNQFDVEYAITMSKTNIDQYIIQANDRLIKQAQTYCAMCRSNVGLKAEKDKGANNSQIVLNKFPIIPEDDPKVANTTHILCKNCIFALKGDLMRMSREGKLNSSSKTIPLKCIVCSKKVHQVELKVLKPLMKDGDGGCCTVL